jgi:hypothetical protein
MAERNRRKGFLSRLWDAITAQPEKRAPERIQPEAPRAPERRTEYITEYRPTSSDNNERLANKLIRQYERIASPRQHGPNRGRIEINHNAVRQNVERMTPEQRALLLPMSDDHLMYEMMMGNITDDEGTNLLWYH